MFRLVVLVFLAAGELAPVSAERGGALPEDPLPASSAVSLAGFRGTLLNGIDPYFIRADHGAVYRCDWVGGSVRWFEGDRVYLSRTSGLADMIKLGEDTSARVEVKEICPLEVSSSIR